MPNQVAYRVYDFLKELEPFSFLPGEVLLRIAGRVEIIYQAPLTVVFRSGEVPEERFFVVKEGMVELKAPLTEGGEKLIERCGEGEIFGIRPLLAEDRYLFTARATEETLLYAVNSNGFRELLPQYPRVLSFLATSMAGSSRFVLRRSEVREPDSDQSTRLLPVQTIPRGRDPVTCPAEFPIHRAAKRMTKAEVGSIVVVDALQRPLGIVTDRDFRTSVATGRVNRSASVLRIMSHPVHCVSNSITVGDAQIEMLRSGRHHLVCTTDGTSDTPVTGVISDHDLLLAQGNSPAALIAEIGRARSTTYLRELRDRADLLLGDYLDKEVAIRFTAAIMTEVSDEITRKCIKLGLQRMQVLGKGNPPALFDWLTLGSHGRGEQLRRTDQDNALVFADVSPNRYAAVKRYFIELADLVTQYLHEVGYVYCEGDMMASNPNWCLSVGKWKEQFTTWMHENDGESLLNTATFFDYRGIWGDGSLPAELTAHIFAELNGSSLRFQASLAQAALQNPSPLTFFRNFVVERSGEHKDQFDLKARAMRPLTDAARVLALRARLSGVYSTVGRYDRLAEAEPQNAELYRQAAGAYELLLRLRARLGQRRGDGGRFVKPEELSQVERLLLRNSFNPVTDIQQLLEVRFQLSFLR